MRRTAFAFLLGALALAVPAVAGCGSAPISAGASASLSQEVASAKTAAASHNVTAALAGLAQVRSNVDRLEGQNQISHSRAADLRASIADVMAQLASLTPAAPTSATPGSVAPGSVPPANGDKHGKDRGNGGGGGGD
ncbi:MAG: hypothetical protein NVSMB32_08630 [Actinomycetota bacterium]